MNEGSEDRESMEKRGNNAIYISVDGSPDSILLPLLVHSTITERLQMVNYSDYG